MRKSQLYPPPTLVHYPFNAHHISPSHFFAHYIPPPLTPSYIPHGYIFFSRKLLPYILAPPFISNRFLSTIPPSIYTYLPLPYTHSHSTFLSINFLHAIHIRPLISIPILLHEVLVVPSPSFLITHISNNPPPPSCHHIQPPGTHFNIPPSHKTHLIIHTKSSTLLSCRPVYSPICPLPLKSHLYTPYTPFSTNVALLSFNLLPLLLNQFTLQYAPSPCKTNPAPILLYTHSHPLPLFSSINFRHAIHIRPLISPPSFSRSIPPPPPIRISNISPSNYFPSQICPLPL